MKVKITCYTPKGKAEKSSKSFGVKYFMVKKNPIETVVVNDHKFYYVYDLTEQEHKKLIDKKIPKAETTIRMFYFTIINLSERANKLAKKGALKVEKVKSWILKRLKKKGYDEKKLDDFIDAIDLSDKDEILKFLANDLFKVRIISK